MILFYKSQFNFAVLIYNVWKNQNQNRYNPDYFSSNPLKISYFSDSLLESHSPTFLLNVIYPIHLYPLYKVFRVLHQYSV